MRPTRPYLCALILAALVGGATPIVAQETEAPSAAAANALFAQGDWAGAARAFRAVTEAEPENGLAWFGLANSLYNTRQVDPAIEAYQKALELKFQPPRTLFLLARAHAAKGEDDAAIEWLTQAAQAGSGLYPIVTATEEFKRLENRSDFRQIIELIRPCNTPTHHLLDFWIGSWTVAAGEPMQQVGRNTIASILNGCAIIENWTDASGNEGKSLFYFHDTTATWKQFWVTDTGQIKEKHMIAQLAGGAVRFQGELRQRDGRIVLDRTTLVPVSKDRVRQVIEQSGDGGENWVLAFDGLYRRAGTEDDEDPSSP